MEERNVGAVMDSSRGDNQVSQNELNLNVLSARNQQQSDEGYNSWDDDDHHHEEAPRVALPTSSREPQQPSKDSDSDDLSEHDSDASSIDLFNIDSMLSKRKPLSKQISPFLSMLKETLTSTDAQHTKQYETLFDEEHLTKDDQLNMEAIEIEDIDDTLIEQEEMQQQMIDEKLRLQQMADAEAEENLEELRHFERRTRENVAINRVKKMQDALLKEEMYTDKHRRRNYREMSDSARYYFKKKEDLVKMKLERMRAFMKPSQTQMEIHKKQWTLEWEKEPQLLDIRMCQIRSIKDTLPEGKYLMLVSLWNRIGGYPMQFSKHVTKVKKSTTEIYHGGQFDDASMVFDEVLRMSGPSVSQITPRMVFMFELLCLSRGAGGQHLRVNKTVGWGVFPAVDNNLKIIQGCFKCPMIKGDVDLSMDKHSQVQRIARKNVKYWLGNFYFEVRHSGVDRVIRKPEEYVLEVLHGKGKAEEDSHDDDEQAQLSSMRIKKKAISYSNPMTTLRKNLPFIGKKKVVSEEADNYFKGSSKNQVLTMQQPKIWFGNPQFSVLEEEQRLVTEDDITSTELETEEYPEMSDEEMPQEFGQDNQMVMENKPLLNHTNMKRATGMESHRPGTDNPRMQYTGRKQLHSVQGSRHASMRHGAGASVSSSRPWTGATSRVGTSHGGGYGMMGDGEMSNSFISRPGVESPLFGKEDELLMFGHQEEGYSSRSTSRYDGTQATSSRAATALARQPQQTPPPQNMNTVDTETETETELDEAPVAYGVAQPESTIKTVKDIQRIYNSLFGSVFELGGASRMDVNFYKQSVKRKKHTWGGTPVYLEKLLYLRRSVLIDMGLSHWKRAEFFLMLIFIFLVLLLRAYPHYLGHWIYLSIMRIPINTTPQSNFYHIAYSFRGEFRTSASNFGFVMSGMLFNMFVSMCMFIFTSFAQSLFSGVPTIIYRFVFLYGLATILDPLLIAAVGAAFRDWDTDIFRLAGYFLLTEKSTVPGVLITIVLVVPLMVIMAILLYQYTLRIHMNRRILDVYKRLHTPERAFFLPHDLEISTAEFKSICEKAKKWRGPDGHTRLVVVTDIPLDRADYIMLNRLDILLSCKKWPADYLTQVMEKEEDMYGSGHVSHIPLEVLSSKARPAVFLRKNQFGKLFSIVNFPMLSDAILFDSFKKRDQRWRLLRLERLLVDYRIIGRMLVPRLRDGKVITGHLLMPELAIADYDIFSTRDVEVKLPEQKPIPTTGIKSVPYRIMTQFSKAKQYISSAVYHAIHKDEDEELFYGDLEMNDAEELDDDPNAEADYRTVCKHIQIYNVSLTRDKTLYRHFVRCPNGSICEVFDKVENQESSTIADIHSNDYWIRKARIDAARRAKKRAKRLTKGQRNSETNLLGLA